MPLFDHFDHSQEQVLLYSLGCKAEVTMRALPWDGSGGYGGECNTQTSHTFTGLRVGQSASC